MRWVLPLLLPLLLAAQPAAAAVLMAGTGQPHPTLAAAVRAAKDGDTIRIVAGTYYECAVLTQRDLVIEGAGVDTVLTDRTCEDKAMLVARGDGLTVRDLVLARARVGDRNGAGIRLEGQGLVLDRVRFENDEVGVLAGAGGPGTIVVRDCTFEHGGRRRGAADRGADGGGGGPAAGGAIAVRGGEGCAGVECGAADRAGGQHGVDRGGARCGTCGTGVGRAADAGQHARAGTERAAARGGGDRDRAVGDVDGQPAAERHRRSRGIAAGLDGVGADPGGQRGAARGPGGQQQRAVAPPGRVGGARSLWRRAARGGWGEAGVAGDVRGDEGSRRRTCGAAGRRTGTRR